MSTITEFIEKYSGIVKQKGTEYNVDNIFLEFPNLHDINQTVQDEEIINSVAKSIDLLSYAIKSQREKLKGNVIRLENVIEEFEKQYPHNKRILNHLYFKLAQHWIDLGIENEEKVQYAFAKSILYAIRDSYNYVWGPVCYKFMKFDNEHSIENIKNEQIYLAKPSFFNDIFDCPVFDYLKENDPSQKYLKETFKNHLWVSCFSNIYKLLHLNRNGDLCSKDKKYYRSPIDYKNVLMWSHYADSHKGICIKYHFSDIASDNVSTNSAFFFDDVRYTPNDVLNKIFEERKGITIHDGLFLKSKDWKYENELRLVYFDIDNSKEKKLYDCPGAIEAVYFGVNCTSDNIKKVIDVLKTKKHRRTEYDNIKSFKSFKTKEVEAEVKFYKMEKDPKHFGKIVAKGIKEIDYSQNN